MSKRGLCSEFSKPSNSTLIVFNLEVTVLGNGYLMPPSMLGVIGSRREEVLSSSLSMIGFFEVHGKYGMSINTKRNGVKLRVEKIHMEIREDLMLEQIIPM